MSDPVNHPEHYNKHPSGIECLDVVQHFNFNMGNAIKYIWRADYKGKPIEDLEKAASYINHEIERRRKEDKKTTAVLSNVENSPAIDYTSLRNAMFPGSR